MKLTLVMTLSDEATLSEVRQLMAALRLTAGLHNVRLTAKFDTKPRTV